MSVSTTDEAETVARRMEKTEGKIVGYCVVNVRHKWMLNTNEHEIEAMSDRTISFFETEVSTLVEFYGWEPFGYPVIVKEKGGWNCVQPMILRSEEE